MKEQIVIPGRRLGRKAIKTDTRTLQLACYWTPALPDPPVACDWTKGISSWGMMLNDTLGDCTIAGRQHAIQVWSANVGTEITLPDADALTAYEEWCGYVDGDASTDNGGVELDVLTDWRQKGVALDGHGLTGFAAANVTQLTEIRQAIALFGGVYIGVSLPLSARQQTEWDVVPDDGSGNAAAGSWGGHCVFVPKYDASSFTCVSWGGLLTMTTAFWNAYCDEAYALFSPDWLANGKAPSGVDTAQLTADLKAIV